MQQTKKNLLLEQIASEAYNVGYTARLHFATFDLATKLPGWVTVLSLAVAVLSLFVPCLGSQPATAVLLMIGISMLYVRHYEERLGEYESVAKYLNEKFKRLHDLSNEVEIASEDDPRVLETHHACLVQIREDVKDKSISRQIFGASWRAHYQFFWVIESAWVAKHRRPAFKFFFDKMPIGFYVAAVLLIATVAAVAVIWLPALIRACTVGGCA